MSYARTAQTKIHLAAPAAAVFAVIVDIAAWGRFSPECSGADVPGQAPLAVGSVFTGHNHSRGRRWRTRCTVTRHEQDHLFEFDSARLGMDISTWTYLLEESPDGGTVLTHTWQDNRGRLMTAIGVLVSGIRDRATHNTESMRVTLERLKQHLEG